MQIEIPHKKELRQFGLIIGSFFVGLFGILFPWLFNFTFPLWPWILATILWSLAILIPNSLKFIYQGWMLIALGLGWVNTHLLLGIVFYLIITPMGLIMRVMGKAPIKPKSSQFESYRNLTSTYSSKHMERPF